MFLLIICILRHIDYLLNILLNQLLVWKLLIFWLVDRWYFNMMIKKYLNACFVIFTLPFWSLPMFGYSSDQVTWKSWSLTFMSGIQMHLGNSFRSFLCNEYNYIARHSKKLNITSIYSSSDKVNFLLANKLILPRHFFIFVFWSLDTKMGRFEWY